MMFFLPSDGRYKVIWGLTNAFMACSVPLGGSVYFKFLVLFVRDLGPPEGG